MKTLLTATIIAATTMIAVPAMAQSVYVGPGGVGFDAGIRHHRDYDRRDYDRRDHDGYGRTYEGRSAYRGHGYDGDRY